MIKARARARPPRCQPPSFQRVTPAGVEWSAYLSNVLLSGPYLVLWGFLTPWTEWKLYVGRARLDVFSHDNISLLLDICQLTALSLVECRNNSGELKMIFLWRCLVPASQTKPSWWRSPESRPCLSSLLVQYTEVRLTTLKAPLGVWILWNVRQCDNWWTQGFKSKDSDIYLFPSCVSVHALRTSEAWT